MPDTEPASKPETKPSGQTPPSRPKPQAGDNRRGAIAGLIKAILNHGVGLSLARELTAASKMQDCVMSGGRICNVFEPARLSLSSIAAGGLRVRKIAAILN